MRGDLNGFDQAGLPQDFLRRRLVWGGLLLPLAGAASTRGWAQAGSATVWRPPAQVNLDYDMQGHWNGPISGSGNVTWSYDASSAQYALDLTISALFLSFLYASRGLYRAETGFLPTSYREKRIGRDRTVRLDYNTGKVSFSWKPESESRDMEPGIQDTTSVMMQIAYLIANSSQSVRTGQRFAFPIARMGSVKHWEFSVMGTPEVRTEVESYRTIHVSRLPPESGSDNDLRVEFWLAPQMHYLPVKMAFNMKDGTYLQVLLRRVRQLVV